LLPKIRELNGPDYQQKFNRTPYRLAYLVAQRPDELIEDWDKIDKHDLAARKLLSNRVGQNLTHFLSAINGQAKRAGVDDPKSRMNVVSSSWTLAKKLKFVFGPKDFRNGTQEISKYSRDSKFGIELVAHLGLLTDEQLLELGPELAKIHSVNGEIWRQVAKRQFAAGKFELAAESFRKALEDATEGMTQAKFNRRVEYANALAKIDRKDEAKKLLKDIPIAKLFESSKKTIDQLKKTLPEN